MQRPIARGASADAGLIFHIFAMDSTSTVGAGKASVAFGSWTCRYIRNGEAISGAITPQDITTIGTYAAPTANTNIRIKAVDNTNMIGVYEIQIHSDWVNTTNSCQSLTIYLTASGVAVLPLQIPLEAVNRQDSVRMGLTALPNAAAEAAGGLYTRGTGAGQIAQQANGQIDANLSTIKTQTVTCAAGVTVLASVGTASTNTAQTGDAYARLGAPAGASVSADVAAVKTDSAAIKLKTDNLPSSPAAVGSAMTLTSAYDPAKTAAQAGDAMALTSGERTTLAAAIWAALTSGLTTVGSVGKLIVDYLDAAISSRSTYAGGDTSGTTTLLSRLTSTRAGNLDNLDAAVSTRSTYAGGDTSGTTTLLSRLTSGRAANLDFLDAAVSGVAAAVWAVGTRTLTAFGFSVTASTVSDKTGYALTSAYDPAKTAAQAGDAMTLTSAYDAAKTAAQASDIPTSDENADSLLGRNLAGGSDGGRTVQDALRSLRNKVSISGDTMTVCAEDDTTAAWTAELTTNASAEPITAVDPA